MRKLTVIRLGAPLVAVGLLLCSAFAVAAQERARIVAVNYPLHYFAERLAGDAAEVEFPVPGNVDPSFWRPSIADISRIQSADLILLNGAGFAAWTDRVSLPRARVVDTSAELEARFITTESITHSHGDGGEHSHEGLASYTWLDPALAIVQAEAIARAIARLDLVPEDTLGERLDTVRVELDAADTVARAALAPLQEIPLIATHPRYQYFARAYDLSIASLEWEAGAAPSEAELAELDALAEETGARVLIWETAPPEGAVDAVATMEFQSATFPPLAHPVEGADFIEAFEAAVSSLAQAALAVTTE
jgi:zinc transport system substrate-binding protein